MNQDKIEILNRTFTSKEIESVIKNLPTITRMNLGTKRKQTHRQEKTLWLSNGRRRYKLGVLDEQIQTTLHKIDKQQGFTI